MAEKKRIKTDIKKRRAGKKEESAAKWFRRLPVLILVFIVLILAVAVIAAIKIIPKGLDFDRTLEEINKVDAQYNYSIQDYVNGIVWLKWNPRFPDTLMLSEMDDILTEYESIREKVSEDERAALLLIDSRINLLEAEKFHRLAEVGSRQRVEDGFRCNDMPDIMDSVEKLNMSAENAYNATSMLDALYTYYPEELSKINITRIWIIAFNMTVENITEKASYRERVINHFCGKNRGNQTDNSTDADFADDFVLKE